MFWVCVFLVCVEGRFSNFLVRGCGICGELVIAAFIKARCNRYYKGL